MVRQILDSKVFPQSTTAKCLCLVCLETVPTTNANNASSNTEQVADIFSNLFKVLCDSMKWTPPNKYQLNFRTDPFPFCKKCRLSVAKLLKNHQLLEEIQDRIDRLTLELSAKILEFQSERSAHHFNQHLDNPEDECEQIASQGTTSIWEKIKYYRNVTRKRYSPSVKLIVGTYASVPDAVEETINEGQLCGSAATDVIDPGVDSDRDQKAEEESEILNGVGDHEDQGLDSEAKDRSNDEGSETLVLKRSTRKTRGKTYRVGEAVGKQIDDFQDSADQSDEDSDYKPDGLPAREESSDENINIQEFSCAGKSKKCGKRESASTAKCTKDDTNEEEQLLGGIDQPFRSLRERVKRVGDFQFVLDDRFPFEFSNNRWKCVSCNIKFAQKDLLRNHLHICPGCPPKPEDVAKTYKYWKCIYDKLTNGQFRCRHCTHCCSSNSEIISHLVKCHVGKRDSHSRYKPWYVEIEPNKYICNQNFPFEFLSEKFKCGTCETSFIAISEILSHIQKEHLSSIPGAIREYTLCESTVPGKFLMNGEFSFEKIGSGDEFQCNQCIYSCQRLRTMKDHIKCKHIDVQRFCCDTCGKKFSVKPNFMKHQMIHGKERPYVCELCGKSFKVRNSLKGHQAFVHAESALKKFTCDKCSKCFGSMNLLRAHAKAHELVICEVCGKQVSNGIGLRLHLETHKPATYACTKCSKKFVHSCSLYAHLKSHDGAKPYSCDICDMKFTQSYSVVRHKNLAHSSAKSNPKSRKRKLGKDPQKTV